METTVSQEEERRLEAVRACRLLDTEPEPAFDDITACAAELLELPIVLVSLVDRTRQWFKSARGLAVTEAPRDAAFCGHVVGAGLPIVVRDTLKDQRFRDHPMVVGPPHVRFYAGVPLRNPDALVLGALGVFDVVPRILEPAKVDVLVQLASQISDRIELRRGAFLLSEERRRVHELTQHAETLLECLEQPVFVHDRRGIVVRANKPALRLLERPVLSTVTGRSALVDLCACLGADRRPFDRETDPALVARRTGKAQSAVMGLTSSTGEVVWFRVSAFPVLVDGEVDTTIVTLSGTAPP